MIGRSWFVREVDGLRQVGHTGSQGGFETQHLVALERDVLGVFVTTRRSGSERPWLDAHAGAIVEQSDGSGGNVRARS